MILAPGMRSGTTPAPRSKSHEHRLLIASFLAGRRDVLAASQGDSADILATKRCLAALAADGDSPLLDCGESGSTMRFLAPIAAALGKKPVFRTAGRLADRPAIEYGRLESGIHTLRGDVSSQFATGLLFALPLLDGDSEIRFSSPLESRGYVDMTLRVLEDSGIAIEEKNGSFCVAGRQRYAAPVRDVEGDWSGAAFWFGMDFLGSSVAVDGLSADSSQPDRAIAALADDFPSRIDVSQFPDIFPVLAVMAAHLPGRTEFSGVRRLRIKECDRVAAMEDVLTRFGARTEVSEGSFSVSGTGGAFRGGGFATYGDHRIAMAIAVGATIAEFPVEIDDAACAAKSYPSFFSEYERLRAGTES